MYSINLNDTKCHNCGGKIICVMKDVNTVARMECKCEKCSDKDSYKDYVAEIDGSGNFIIKPKE